MDPETSKKNEDLADSPTSVLGVEEMCKEETGNGSDGVETGAEEDILQEAGVNAVEEEEVLNDSKLSKLDELLTQAKLYSDFLLENMADITSDGDEEVKAEEELVVPKKRGRKRKAGTQYNTKKAKKAVAAMLSRSDEGNAEYEDANLTEEQRAAKEQERLVPLFTGGTLKPYQIKGVKWMLSLWKNGLNGILADQMGLGKTIQTIGFLAHLKGKGIHGPYLVIGPLSTLSNWGKEISRFTPSINAVIYHGDATARDQIRRKQMPTQSKTKTIEPNFPIVITSYEIAMSDARRYLSKYSWKYVVIDEGHRLKNTKCKLLKELKFVPMENKLLITGTPLQNNLAELWSLLNFLLPDIFNSLEEFESWFDLSGKCSAETEKEEFEERRRAQVVQKLHEILRPFLLRRLKSDVELMLPRKKEIILYATMTDHQKDLQKHLMDKTFEAHMAENKGGRNKPTTGKLNNLCIQLRKNCYHPDLIESAYDESISGTVWQIPFTGPANGETARSEAQNLIDYYFSEKGHQVCRIDGKVKLDERKRQIEEFNDIDSEYRIFILSTRAGGLGINLTSADTCIIYDSDWNPQADLQAMDRCHRIGQTRPVHVYRLATAQSVEGRLLKRAFSKLKLEHDADILALLKDVEDPEEKIIQTDISDGDLDRVMDRTDLIVEPKSEEDTHVDTGFVLPLKGPGWEVILPVTGGGMLSTLNS
ncbi:hypothetical protein MKX03_016671 [Papaver bracteatum]|nr:hypothetical protein MKX03_016671 [Papaver bracteatum]